MAPDISEQREGILIVPLAELLTHTFCKHHKITKFLLFYGIKFQSLLFYDIKFGYTVIVTGIISYEMIYQPSLKCILSSTQLTLVEIKRNRGP